MSHKLLIVGCLLSTIALSAWAVEDPLPDPGQERHAYDLFHEVGCLYCQDKSIADSPTDMAAEIRRTIREHVAAGDSDVAIKNYLNSHFGDTILMPWPQPIIPRY
jgi:cytochrome c-type biogenesis protein CcmH